MKKNTFIVLFFFPLSLLAQMLNKADTVIMKDPLNPNREYWIIHNFIGSVEAQGFMINGRKDGMWRLYNSDHNTIYEMQEYSNGVLNGASQSFYINGSMTKDETYLNNKLNGPSRYMNNYGQVKVVENYKDSILDGSKQMFYEGGKLQEDGVYKNGKRNGVFKWYRSDGTPSLEYTYDNGTLQGSIREYDEKGGIKKMGQFEKDSESGEWKEYKDSVLVKKIIYKEGQIVKEIPVKK